MKIGDIEVKQFSGQDIDKLEPGSYWFERSMVSTCQPLFNECGSNYEVEDKLVRAKVISKADDPDTESCALVVNFKTKAQGVRFINRLNKYLVKKAKKLQEARDL